MEVIFFNLSLRYTLVMKILKSQPIKHRANERPGATAALLARSCFIVSTKLCVSTKPCLRPAQLAV
jgi:hypothetical protein